MVSTWEMQRTWLNPGNHNFLRITRILGSLAICNCKEYAGMFWDALDEITGSVWFCQTARTYWQDALTWE